MNYSTEMNEIIEERYRLCIWLYRIKKETDMRNKEKRFENINPLLQRSNHELTKTIPQILN